MTTKEINERAEVCRKGYETNEKFKTYIDKLIGKGGNMEGYSLDSIFKHDIIYEIYMYYLNYKEDIYGRF